MGRGREKLEEEEENTGASGLSVKSGPRQRQELPDCLKLYSRFILSEGCILVYINEMELNKYLILELIFYPFTLEILARIPV